MEHWKIKLAEIDLAEPKRAIGTLIYSDIFSPNIKVLFTTLTITTDTSERLLSS